MSIKIVPCIPFSCDNTWKQHEQSLYSSGFDQIFVKALLWTWKYKFMGRVRRKIPLKLDARKVVDEIRKISANLFPRLSTLFSCQKLWLCASLERIIHRIKAFLVVKYLRLFSFFLWWLLARFCHSMILTIKLVENCAKACRPDFHLCHTKLI